uniref:Pentatricopeptide repeat-containing protein n=1 Tax=Nelumbo nucifera TaxID=4432 RepID=A0A822Z0Y7_NELNU|nr:TPA_asm: hypothetical protein HUJ06_009078 [Nelumbo nucifera]
MMFSSSLKCYPSCIPPPKSHCLSLSLSCRPTSFISSASLKPYKELTTSLSSDRSPISASSSSAIHQLPPNFTPKDLLGVLRRQNDAESALRVFDWASKQPNFVPTPSTYQEILQQLGKVGSFESMNHLLKEMKLSGCEIDKVGGSNQMFQLSIY